MFEGRRVIAVTTWAQQAAARQSGEELVPVLPSLGPLFPDGGLRRGSVVSVAEPGYLPLALAAGASGGGAWSAFVGMPEAGMLAAAGMGVDLDRLLLVDEPGERWAEAVAALLDGVELVLVRPPVRPAGAVRRRLGALARRHGSVLVAVGSWEGAALRLRVGSSLWLGLGEGHGHLRGRRVQVVAEGRGGAGRPRVVRLWLPAPDGTVLDARVLPDGLSPDQEDVPAVPGAAGTGAGSAEEATATVA
jgi:hypothetical protein